MIVGDPSEFAIESSIEASYPNPALRALGMFLIHLEGIEYGVREKDATILSNSFDAVTKRLAGRGAHRATFAIGSAAMSIASCYLEVVYGRTESIDIAFGSSPESFKRALFSNGLVWAPDGGAAFDDGSHVLQFDCEDRVRLIGFKHTETWLHDLTEVVMSAERFYGVLAEWQTRFLEEAPAP